MECSGQLIGHCKRFPFKPFQRVDRKAIWDGTTERLHFQTLDSQGQLFAVQSVTRRIACPVLRKERDGNPSKIFVRDGEEQGASFSRESVNVVLHQRRTGILRQKLCSLKKREEPAITIYEPELIESSSFPR